MSEISWYHVFDSTNELWLNEQREWNGYPDAEEFGSFEEAHGAARETLAREGNRFERTPIILADYGAVGA